MSIIITDEDISQIEGIFLPGAEHFDEERRTVIRCLESKTVIACPGSGKTTALLAKLAILSKKMPFEDNKGICVLTHTNVAIDEIRARLGSAGNILFKYPNFFGTIQSFVDTFLAIPAYSHYYPGQIIRIDNEIYNETISRDYKNLSKNVLTALAIKAKIKKRSIPEELSFVRFDPSNFNNLVDGINGDDSYKDKKGKTFGEILALKNRILEKGILCFDDAYSLAFRYIRDFSPLLRNAFSNRFLYVFIDEVQDADSHQLMIVDQIFDPSLVVIQKLGDPNQAIYISETSGKSSTIWEIENSPLKINGSMRFSCAIADKIKLLCLNRQDIKGNCKIPNISPKILVFNDSNVCEVLDKFIDLILENKLNLLDRKKYKVIGWVGKEKETKRTIPSYFHDYNRTVQLKQMDFIQFEDYLNHNKSNYMHDCDACVFRNNLLRAILKLLRLAEIKDENSKNFSERSFLKHIQDNYPEFNSLLMINLAKWCLNLANNEDVFDEAKHFFLTELRSIFRFKITNNISDFFNKKSAVPHPETLNDSRKNTFTKKGITLELATVHSVKGETHSATLYLETFYYMYDINRIIKYLKGIYDEPNSLELEALKVTFVGMSRPTHLLCIAAHETTILRHKKDLEKIGWEIINI